MFEETNSGRKPKTLLLRKFRIENEKILDSLNFWRDCDATHNPVL